MCVVCVQGVAAGLLCVQQVVVCGVCVLSGWWSAGCCVECRVTASGGAERGTGLGLQGDDD